jgi:superfamily II DNA/RNA helicase
VATYTGHDDRRDREASGEAFCSPLGPWILVASNVGSEGIDLQTYSEHLVHFDIEWNPARMEQREGRIDRVGRRLPDHVNVHYMLVQKTYDERMLHQLVARQRWHAVLLGRQGARLAKDCDGTPDARLLNLTETNSLTLDLRPSGFQKTLR